jgi:hypothetical protein
MRKEYLFLVHQKADRNKGRTGFLDTVTIRVESQNSDREPKNFERFIRDLSEWYDGAKVSYLPEGKQLNPFIQKNKNEDKEFDRYLNNIAINPK